MYTVMIYNCLHNDGRRLDITWAVPSAQINTLSQATNKNTRSTRVGEHRQLTRTQGTPEMGNGPSRRRPGPGSPTGKRFKIGLNHPAANTGYFIISMREDKIKVVNAESTELRLVTGLIRRHCTIVKEGWDRHLTYSYKMRVSGRHCLIQLVADTLLCLYKAGWQPMTPVDMGRHKQKHNQSLTNHTAICFRRCKDPTTQLGSTDLLLAQASEEQSCLCLETYKDNFLGFHNVSHAVLLELVTTIQSNWLSGVTGVSTGVASVISDYCTSMPKVLHGYSDIQHEKFIKLEGKPWAFDPQDSAYAMGSVPAEKLQSSIVACLSDEGYTLGLDINMDTTSRVFFFIKSGEDNKKEVIVPNNSGAGLGEKDSLSMYRPLLHRHKSSFFRSCNGKNASLRRKVQASLRRKAVARQGRQHTAMSYKPARGEPAWWQQRSTDASTDYDDTE